MAEWRPNEFYGRKWLGNTFLRVVVSPRLDQAYGRAFALLTQLPTAVKVEAIMAILDVVGRVTVTAWVREHTVTAKGSAQSRDYVGTHSGEEALYTGGGIYLKKPLDMSELDGLGFRSTGPQNLRADFWQWIESQGWAAIKKVALEGDAAVGVEPVRTLAHEYCHWQMTKGTTLANVVESVSWRVTLDEIMLCDLLAEIAGLPMGFEPSAIKKMTDEKDKIRKRLISSAEDPRVRGLLLDLVRHHFYAAFYYPTVLSVLLEPTAWILVEDPSTSLEEQMRVYFHDEVFPPYRYAKRVLELSKTYLVSHGGNPAARKEIIDAVHGALDFPLRWNPSGLNLLGIGESSSQEVLMDYLVGRFESRLGGQKSGAQLAVARKGESHFVDAMGYALWFRLDKELGKEFTRRMLDLIRREPELFNHVLRNALRMFAEPTFDREVLVVNVLTEPVRRGAIVHLRYDNLVDVSQLRGETLVPTPWPRKTGKALERLDDLIGDVPPTIPTALTLLRDLEEARRLEKQGTGNDPNPALERAESRGNVLRRAGANAFERYVQAVRGPLMSHAREGLSYRALLENGPSQVGAGAFLSFWFDFVMSVGEDGRILACEPGMSA